MSIEGWGKEQEIAYLAGNAMAHAIYPFTWGLVQNSLSGEAGKELGGGVAIQWKGAFLIVTAAHVINKTPDEQLYYFPPAETLQIVANESEVQPEKLRLRERLSLATPRANLLYGIDDLDLAVIRLPQQRSDYAARNFFALEGNEKSPDVGRSVVFLGYPGAKTITYGENFAATPNHAFGRVLSDQTCPHDEALQIATSYQPGDDIYPAGLSGSGVWFADAPGIEGTFWAPRLRIGGIVTDYCAGSSVLLGYRIETVTRFLESLKDQIIE